MRRASASGCGSQYRIASIGKTNGCTRCSGSMTPKCRSMPVVLRLNSSTPATVRGLSKPLRVQRSQRRLHSRGSAPVHGEVVRRSTCQLIRGLCAGSGHFYFGNASRISASRRPPSDLSRIAFRWLVGPGIDDAVLDHATLSKSRDRLLDADVAAKSQEAVLCHPRVESTKVWSGGHEWGGGLRGLMRGDPPGRKTVTQSWRSTRSARPSSNTMRASTKRGSF